MEGPSLKLAQEQLQPFARQRVQAVSGNTSIAKERMDGQLVRELFAWGKHLVLQFDGFALRVHFLLFGTYEADVAGASVTGDYKRARTPRLTLTFPNGELRLYNCSVQFIEGDRVKRTYDHTIDILSRTWDPAQALRTLAKRPTEAVGDVLLDQAVFAGVGNIIRNEVLALQHLHPLTPIAQLSTAKRKAVIVEARSFSQKFLRWRRRFELRKHLIMYGRGTCPYCGGKVSRTNMGRYQRRTFFCPVCQPLTGQRRPTRSHPSTGS
ncbi:MAG TPA: endonuclease [Flavobacteriales bacterium]|jgi:endonuclease-8|nr:endonuclease [Flavobacteriales bacterium]